jgi:NAD(P)-dependent dehydrogenase (short-subunit alcohol dehydrogenase family)
MGQGRNVAIRRITEAYSRIGHFSRSNSLRPVGSTEQLLTRPDPDRRSFGAGAILFHAMSMNQKTALVTGANKGIGLEAARQLAGLGWRVFLAARNREAGETAAQGIGAELVVMDVADEASVTAAAQDVSGRAERLDVLVNNAGIVLDWNGNVFDLSAGVLRETLETNLFGPLRVAQAFLPLLRKSDAPRIINVSSGAGQLSGELQAWAPAYSISKTALNSLTLQLAAALPKFAVNSVCPGWVRTDMGGSSAPRSVDQGADVIVWLAAEAQQSLTGKFVKDRKVIEW